MPESADLSTLFKDNLGPVSCTCFDVVHDVGHGSDLTCQIGRIIVCSSVTLKKVMSGFSLTISSGGFIVIGDSMIVLTSSFSSSQPCFADTIMSPLDCVNAALVAYEQSPLETTLEDASVSSEPTVSVSGALLSSLANLQTWRPSDTPCLISPVKPVNHRMHPLARAPPPPGHHQSSVRHVRARDVALDTAPSHTPAWLTRRTDTGALAELFIYHYLLNAYPSLSLSAWVSSAKRRFFPDDKTRVNDALGADFEFVDSNAVFSKNRGSLVRLEVKGSVRSLVTQFEVSRNELKGFATSNSGGCEYAIVLVADVGNEGRSPWIARVIRKVEDLGMLEPIQFLCTLGSSGRGVSAVGNVVGVPRAGLPGEYGFGVQEQKEKETKKTSGTNKEHDWIQVIRASMDEESDSSESLTSSVGNDELDAIRRKFNQTMERHRRKDDVPDCSGGDQIQDEFLFVEDVEPDETIRKRRKPELSSSSWYPLRK